MLLKAYHKRNSGQTPVQVPSSPTSIFSPNSIQLIPPNHPMIAWDCSGLLWKFKSSDCSLQQLVVSNALLSEYSLSWSIFIQLGQVLFISPTPACTHYQDNILSIKPAHPWAPFSDILISIESGGCNTNMYAIFTTCQVDPKIQNRDKDKESCW